MTSGAPSPTPSRRGSTSTPRTGSPRPSWARPSQTHLPDGRVAVDGVVEEVEPPHRLVHTWHPVYDDDLAAEPPSRVAWELTPAGDGPDAPAAHPQCTRAESAHVAERARRLGVDPRLPEVAAGDRHPAASAHPHAVGRVRISAPSSVMATVCSLCAVRDPVALRSVQPSASVTSSSVPAMTHGSIASRRPGRSR